MSSPPDLALSFSALLGCALLLLLLSLLLVLLSDGLLGGEFPLAGGEEEGGALDGVEGELGGGVGGCGVVGLLALGQPLSSMQAAIKPSTLVSTLGFKNDSLFWNSIGFHNILSWSWFPIRKTGAKCCFSQGP
jgi:hypothetical protein